MYERVIREATQVDDLRSYLNGVMPAQARELAFRPLELAHVDGEPLAAQDVTLVMEPPATPAAQSGPVGGRLRVLGLFSLPEGGQPLNLRRERQALVTLIRGIDAAARGPLAARA